MQTVVEGVETPGQLELVRDIGADYVQGFLLHRPAPALEAVQLLTGAVEVAAGQPGTSGRVTPRTAAMSGHQSR
jgi:predicted signal transduction protein with EAL and GGDEF domain